MPVTATRSVPKRSMIRSHTSSRRADSTSTSMSGSDRRRTDRNRSKSRSWSRGFAVATNRLWLTIEPAPDPRAATRIPIARTSATTWATARKYASYSSFPITPSSYSSCPTARPS
ncbi:hypothetical protein SLAVM298S_03043 [Streptomyces lavendulae subsp. lavendulae]